MNHSNTTHIRLLLAILPFLIGIKAVAQSDDIFKFKDSLIQEINRIETDTGQIYALNDWVLDLKSEGKYILSLELNQELLKRTQAFSKNDDEELQRFGKIYLARGYNNNGNIKKKLGDLPGALEDLQLSLSLKEKNGNLNAVASTMNNIGLIHASIGNYDLADEYYRKALTLNKQLDNTLYISKNYSNIAALYIYQHAYDSARHYLRRSLLEKKKINDVKGMALIYNNMGHVADQLGDKERTFAYMDTSLTYYRSLNNNRGLAFAMLNSGFIRLRYKAYHEARHLLDSAFLLIDDMKDLNLLKYSHHYLAKLDSAQGDYKSALNHFQNYMLLRDSLLNEESVRKIARSELQFEYEKKEAIQLLEQERKDAETQATISQKNMQRNFLMIAMLPLIVILVLIFRGYKQKKVSNLMLAEKNREITDSINYAKRIQSAILPPAKIIKEHLPDSFVLYKPKDIVAGDFYWLEPQHNKVLFAAADCTGHGVPGAMVSVVCNNGLNRAVREYGLTDPGEILNKTREIVVQEFEKSEEDVKDGMDIALCSLEQNTLHYAGAHNPLWIIRNNSDEIEEIKADKQHIGQTEHPAPFTTHEVTLQKGDTVYIFSDGYADQFGGEKGKKLKTANFKKLLLSIKEEPIEKQLTLIDEAFENWRGDLEQLDDVCVIGVRV